MARLTVKEHRLKINFILPPIRRGWVIAETARSTREQIGHGVGCAGYAR